MSTIDFLPLIKAPAAWPAPVVTTIAMAGLAGLDLIGSIAAKEWMENRTVLALTVGVSTFVVLWWVYASSLQYGQLAIITMGWMVILQVGLLVVDHLRYAAELPPGRWVAVVVVLGAQVYLLLTENSETLA
jgi:hypothetical protein